MVCFSRLEHKLKSLMFCFSRLEHKVKSLMFCFSRLERKVKSLMFCFSRLEKKVKNLMGERQDVRTWNFRPFVNEDAAYSSYNVQQTTKDRWGKAD